MPRFEPFPGIRYDLGRVPLDQVVAPPYDVIGPDERAALESRSDYNSVHVELARETDGEDRYTVAARRFGQWQADGVLVADPTPAFYVYRMGFHDEDGRPRQTTGVIGALALSGPDEGQVLPHERTMGKPKDDRLRLLGATGANLSPVWCLSLAAGLSELCDVPEPPAARCTDEDGVHHRLWPVTQPGRLEAIASVVASAPVVIADGHHRYETALAYREEIRAGGAGAGDHDLIMAFVVELAEEQLSVRPIHRLVSGLPADFDLTGALAAAFEMVDAGPADASVPFRMGEAGAMALVQDGRVWLLRPRAAPGGPEAVVADSAVLAGALAALPAHEVRFHHSAEEAMAMVAKGEVQAGFLLRPVPVTEISRVAWAQGRMPEKTTFFHPKPRTGLVFRRLACAPPAGA